MKTITRDKIIKSTHDRVNSLSIVHKELETPTKNLNFVKKLVWYRYMVL